MRPGGLPYDDSGFEMVVLYDGRCGRSTCEAQAHPWRVRWQEQRDFPLGTYRLRVEGRAFKGGQPTPYMAQSNIFEVVPSTQLQVYDLTAQGGQLEGRIIDPPALHLEEQDEGIDAERAAILLRSTEVPASLGAPLPDAMSVQLSATIRPVGTSTPTPMAQEVSLSRVTEPRQRLVGYDAEGAPRYQDAGQRPTSRFVLDGALPGPGDYVVQLSLTDPLGNMGTITATITQP